jgi:hypothetical protein
MKWRFTIAGATVGLLCACGLMVYVFIKGPGYPGTMELLVQMIIVSPLVAAGALLGLFVGWIVSLCVRKK